MDDLVDLKWDGGYTNPAAFQNGRQNSIPKSTPSPSIPFQHSQPQRQSGTATPPLGPGSSAKATSQDSFATLLAPKPSSKKVSLTLEERQKQLLEERTRRAGGGLLSATGDDVAFLDALHSGKGGLTAATPTTDRSGTTTPAVDEDDILAAFNASVPVDASSHYPPSSTASLQGVRSARRSTNGTPANDRKANIVASASLQANTVPSDEDDPFGLDQVSNPTKQENVPSASIDDDDLLGDLGKPVSEAAAKRKQDFAGKKAVPQRTTDGDSQRDHAIAELVDMGFSADQARDGLQNAGSSTDIQGAVTYLLNKAHEDSRSRSRARNDGQPVDGIGSVQSGSAGLPAEGAVLDVRRQSQASRTDSRSPAAGDIDMAQYASQLRSNFIKSANSLWKTGHKRMQKAMDDLKQDSNSSQPRWMRDTGSGQATPDGTEMSSPLETKNAVSLTDEAAMLEPGRAPPSRRTERPPAAQRPANPPEFESTQWYPSSTTANELPERRASPFARAEAIERRPSPSGPIPIRAADRPQQKLNRELVEEQSSQAYISPARRKKAQPATTSSEPELDIFSDQPAKSPAPKPTSQPPPQTRTTMRSAVPLRPKLQPRNAPPLPPNILANISAQRAKGSESFRRGDYAEAHTAYTNALSSAPNSHPITIVLHCNLATTNMKVGSPKAAIASADAALATIGPSRGENETIELGDAESAKPMKEFYGKALLRRAEALESLEKWPEAASAWRLAVEAGVGGAMAIQARGRCERAAAGPASDQAAASAVPARRPVSRPKPKAPSASSALGALNGEEAESVKRLREANAAAAAASDEAFALNDVVEARLTSWKSGKEGNLRGLLASLETVLWEGAQWNKVGMGDLVLSGKVKIIYMKAIAKVHPDKLSQTATTEQKMISAAVFATLNEAWDKFKKDNNL